ncbi:MAG: phosphotransferase [Cellulophaga sp.]|uniref:phosphotransferase n=1 Tax=unclassified Cellulophaga TaxID=2634405 RepID=UPI000C2BFDEC|nr:MULTISPECIES: phosphotransferase [unclassified Cellulophaga]MDO6489778.1 phosphotransferase [Cellulophaga sp. 2_MG-2023]MDO6495028.1 phosphotransferase [Cellulophaga sp. 3_MG-2023]PKB42593.1 5-methylthioribose kinase [Cellulophaga sp. RHA19]
MIKLNNNIEDLTKYLQSKDWLKENESIVAVEKPGEGNMNFTLRILTETRSFIVKQSRDYVEKYPQVAAPAERVLREAEFYEVIESVPSLKAMMPTLIGLDKDNSVMVMEDLGNGSDFTYLYQLGKEFLEEDLFAVIDFAACLHTSITTETQTHIITNTKMRKLNHEHIFNYPYAVNNGINLDDILPGLQKEANRLKADNVLKAEIKKLGDLYLEDGDILLHGDYFPGSWLATVGGLKIIDPEFCFFGKAEFEIGVMLAHLKMANQSSIIIEKAVKRYKSLADLDDVLCYKFMAIEILRRIIGLAQLPLEIRLEKRIKLLNESREILVS